MTIDSDQLQKAVREEFSRLLEDPNSKFFQTLVKSSAFGAEQAIEAWAKNSGCEQCFLATTQQEREYMKKLSVMVQEFEPVQIRENHEFVVGMRKKAEKIGMVVLIAVATTLTGGVLAAIWHFVRTGAGGGK